MGMAEPLRPKAFQLEEVPDADSRPSSPTTESKLQNAAVATLMLAIKTLSQRTLVALSKLFTLFTVLLVYFVWTAVPDPNPHQLIGMGMFASFILVVNWIVLRRGE